MFDGPKYNRTYYQKNSEGINAKAKNYRQENREKINASAMKNYYKNREKIKAKNKKYNKKCNQELREPIIISRLKQAGIVLEEYPKELIELKRSQILFHRELKKGREVLSGFSANV